MKIKKLKQRNRAAFIAMALVMAAFAACNRVPGYVIQPDDMAQLMADVRMADAVVSIQRTDYSTEASKLALKNAVFERHGVTAEQFDTSLMWYGRNIGIYQDVTKKSIEILEQRLKDASILAAGEAAMSVSGDSVDIWDGPRVFPITNRSPSQYVTFVFNSDPNWEPGDVYTLRSRMLTPAQYAQWNLMAVYDDGAIETITSNISLDNPARQELTLITDSTRTATRISGWINIEPMAGRPAIVDSISLMRRRTSPDLARTRKYAQKLIVPKNEESKTDSVQPADESHRDERPEVPKGNENKVPGPFRINERSEPGVVSR